MARCGLTLHASKCKVQTNLTYFQQRGAEKLAEGFTVEVLEEGEGLSILGVMLGLMNPTGSEIQIRIASG